MNTWTLMLMILGIITCAVQLFRLIDFIEGKVHRPY